MPGIDSYTVLMLHMNGTDGSTTFTDSSSYAHSGTANGNAQIDTAQSKFGSASGLFDGTGDYVSFSDSSDWNFGPDDFTIDFWIKFNSLSGTQAIVTQWGGGGSNGSFYLVKLSSNVLAFFYSTTGSSETEIDSTYTFSDSSWHHVAVVRDGTTLRFFVDGTAYGTGSMSGVTIYNSTRNLNVSTYSDGTGQSVNGWIDELRISKGIARWTSAFTPPTEEYGSDVTVSLGVLSATVSLPTIALPNVTISMNALSLVANAMGIRTRTAQSTSYAVKIISYNPLIFISNSNPVQITKVATTSADNPTWEVHNITGAALPTDVAIDTTNGYIYMSTSSGQVYKINSTTFSYSVINLSDSDNLINMKVDSSRRLAHTSTSNSVGELYLIDERSISTINLDFKCAIQSLDTIDANFNLLEGKRINLDFKVLSNQTIKFKTNLVVLSNSYSSISPIGVSDVHLYINDVELGDNEVDLKSIIINHYIGEKSTATFRLTRKHDQLDTDINGDYSQITNKNTVKIYLGNNLEFNGRISQLLCSYNKSSEIVSVKALMTQPSAKYDLVNISLPGLTENRHLYHIILQDINIYNEDILETEKNPKKFFGIKISLGEKNKQSIERFKFFGNCATLADKLINGTFIPKQNFSYFWFVNASKIPVDVASSSGQSSSISNSKKASTSSIYSQSNSSISDFIQSQKVLFQDINRSTQVQFSSNGVSSSVASSLSDLSTTILQYIGLSLGGLNSALWKLNALSYYYQRENSNIITKLGTGIITSLEIDDKLPGQGTSLFNILVSKGYISNSGIIQDKFKMIQSVRNFDLDIGVKETQILYNLLTDSLGYYIGQAPYKQISTTNGVLESVERWVDRGDGLYAEKDDAYNYIDYVKKVAELEFLKIKNINGDILPITNCNTRITIDAYYFYKMGLLKRVNIDNTTTNGIYKNSNGFPVAIKSIVININDMSVSLDMDNQKSDEELEIIDGNFPNEFDSDYYQTGYSKKIFDKYDLQTGRSTY